MVLLLQTPIRGTYEQFTQYQYHIVLITSHLSLCNENAIIAQCCGFFAMLSGILFMIRDSLVECTLSCVARASYYYQ